MCPRLLEIGPFTIYSYGLMLAIGFIAASYLLTLELKRRDLDPNLGNNVTLLALVGGIAGSKILFLLEHFNLFMADPFGMAFSPSGLTFYGGFILATILIYFYVKKKGVKFFTIADSVSPGLLLGYGIARIGCHLSGDGDYGFPTTLPWGTNYSKGTYPPSAAFKNFPEVTGQFPNGIVPDNTLCHPTPVYEFLLCAVLFALMWKWRKSLRPDGKMFMLYLIFAGAERFVIEFFRLNPRMAFGLSEAQLIAVVLIAVGLYGWTYFSKHTREGKPA
ncbi:MAG: prolipoprotein diacylglyceryl transferase [Ignavibacteriales bacterium]|nr:prolipoprotein diacylglyceryl transferase [Ignavibacteriales bacterium]